MNITILEDKAEEAAELLGLLSSAHRLRILCLLVEGEMSVGELAEATKMRQATVSQHLSLLRAHKIVSVRREGTSAFYSIAHHGAEAMIEALYRFYCQPAKKPRRK